MTSLVERLVRDQFAIRTGELIIGGVGVSELAKRFGTPFFAYDRGVLVRSLANLRAHLPDRIDLHYSVKANPNPAIVRCFVEEGLGLEIASAGEYQAAIAAGGASGRILFAGPAKTDQELDFVVARGIGEIHLESEEEIARLDAIAGSYSVRVKVALRVNPAAGGSGGAMRMGGQPAAFGVDEERLDEALQMIFSSPNLDFQGVHMFAGTQVLDAGILVNQWRHALDVARQAATIAGSPLRTVDFGGGLGIPYFANDASLDLAALREHAAKMFSAIDGDPEFQGTRFVLEPGRHLAGPCGVYVCRVQSVKVSRGRTFVLLDGGMHHHLAASGNLGQVIKKDYPIVNATRCGESPAGAVTVAGCLCTPLDTLGRDVKMPETRAGDLVAVLQSGAYALTASPVGFLSHPAPAEILVSEGHVTPITA